jgi:hypothetical protein
MSRLLFGNNFIMGIVGCIIVACVAVQSHTKKFMAEKYFSVFLLLFLITLAIGALYGGYMQMHYIIALHTALILFTALGIYHVAGKHMYLLLLVGGIFLLVNASQWNLHKTVHPLQDGLSIRDFKKAASIIREDTKGTYNVAMHAQGDNRAMPLRYTLTVLGESPLHYDTYGDADTLYFIVPNDEKLDDQTMWEYTSFGPSFVIGRWKINDGYILYKLGKKQNVS